MLTYISNLLILLLVPCTLSQYVPPKALVEPLSPKGIRISIPHEDGISLVAFHVKFNDEFMGLEAGTISRDIVKPKNGNWVYQDKTTKLKKGDVIYYWIHVVYEGLGYNLIDQEHVVKEFVNIDEQKVESATTNRTSEVPTPYRPPKALVQALSPKGIRISIPHEDGISLVAFHIKFNDEFVGLEAGTIARDIVKPKNGNWVYQDKTTKLKKGDVIYYWIHVVYEGLGYNLIDQEHLVTEFTNSDGQEIESQTTTTTKVSATYSPPEALVEPLHPKGIRLSIPHEDGITLVAYHVKFNDEFMGLEAGTISRDIVKPKNGRWVYQDKTTKLKKGDVIYYWLHVVYEGLGYNLIDQEHVVTEFFTATGRN